MPICTPVNHRRIASSLPSLIIILVVMSSSSFSRRSLAANSRHSTVPPRLISFGRRDVQIPRDVTSNRVMTRVMPYNRYDSAVSDEKQRIRGQVDSSRSGGSRCRSIFPITSAFLRTFLYTKHALGETRRRFPIWIVITIIDVDCFRKEKTRVRQSR